MLFVDAVVTDDGRHTIGGATTEEFVRVEVTNALSPMRVVEMLQPLVPPTGPIGAMSSGQGSFANDETGMRDVRRGSEAALNMFMRSFTARNAADPRAMVAMAPGWVRTDRGGPNARPGIEDSVPKLVDVLPARRRRPGLRYLDYRGDPVPRWSPASGTDVANRYGAAPGRATCPPP